MTPKNPLLTVSELTAQIKYSLSELFASISVRGEVSDLTRARSGHIYFNLKDSTARISATLWRHSAERLRFDLDEGLEVVCFGKIDVYGPRGTYQLNVQRIEPLGVGGLQLAFDQLRKRLEAEGLFAADRKRTLPHLPRRIGVVTSPEGAAVRDFLQVLSRRFPNLDITVVGTRVQGPGAAREIASALQQANRIRPRLDAIALCRGGGSLEDLWSFNEEVVVRAVAASDVPVITGIGHEVDLTLADLAADIRALTPSEAAERLVPQKSDLLEGLLRTRIRLVQALENRHRHASQLVDSLSSRPCFRFPLERISQHRQRLDELNQQLQRRAQNRIETGKQQLSQLAATLEALSPLAILGRGYSVTTDGNGNIISSADQVQPDALITTRLHLGSITSRVIESGLAPSEPVDHAHGTETGETDVGDSPLGAPHEGP